MTKEEYLYIIFNAILYIGLLLWYWKKTHFFNIGMLLLSIWAASASFAILYEPNNFIGHIQHLQLFPFIFIFILNLIAFYPILKFNHRKLTTFRFNADAIRIICIIIGIISILPLTENSIYFISHFSSTGFEELLKNMNERYSDSNYERLSYLSNPAFICSRLLGFFGLNLLSLLLITFPLVQNIKNHKFAFTGIILGNLNFLLESINIFARFNIVIQMIMLSSAYIIIYRFYPKFNRKKINLFAFGIIFSILSVFTVVTIYRLQGWNSDSKSNNQGILIYAGQYLCEGMPNFSADRYRATVYDKIEEMEAGIRSSLLREKKIPKFRSNKTGYRGELVGPQFSTWIGNFYLSLGPYWIFVVFLLFSLWIFWKMPKGKQISFAQCYLFIAYLRIPILGIFFNTYAVAPDELIGELFLIPFFYFIENKHNLSIRIRN